MSIVKRSDRKLTYLDYVEIPEDRSRHEILDGAHYVTPSPSSSHQSVLVNLTVQLHQLVQQTGLGRVFVAPMDVLLGEFDIVQPDLVVVLKSNDEIITKKNIQGAPDLLVEILSPSTASRDRSLKKSRYERAGVSEYWIVDIDLKEVEQFCLSTAGVLESCGRFRDTITPSIASGATVDLTAVW